MSKTEVIVILEELKKTCEKACSENADPMEIANDIAFESERYAKAIEYCLGELGRK